MNTTATESRHAEAPGLSLNSRNAALDGWRGIAILLVLFDHIQAAFIGHYSRPWLQTGQHGVTIFFVLSGFLITSRLLGGPINLKQFYVRRFCRLMPAAWTYLAVLVVLTVLTGVSFTSWPEVRACLLFYRNMTSISGPGLAGHFWSLSLEEQFYLVWPCLLLLAGVRRSRWIAIGGILACAAYRWIDWNHYNRLGLNDRTQVRADALLVGCVAALLISFPRQRSFLSRVSRILAIPAGAVLIACIARYHWLPPLRENVAIALLLVFTTLHPTSITARKLSFRPLVWIGLISYSIYVWQELFMHLGYSTPGKLISIGIVMPAFAIGSYYLIERPITRFGRRLTPSASPITLVTK